MELPAHWRGWGLDLELADDVTAADWLDGALRLATEVDGFSSCVGGSRAPSPVCSHRPSSKLSP